MSSTSQISMQMKLSFTSRSVCPRDRILTARCIPAPRPAVRPPRPAVCPPRPAVRPPRPGVRPPRGPAVKIVIEYNRLYIAAAGTPQNTAANLIFKHNAEVDITRG